MASRNGRRLPQHVQTLPLFDRGHFIRQLSEQDARTMELRGQIVPYFQDLPNGKRRAIGYKLVVGFAGESDSPTSPCSITFAEILAAVGISRYRFGFIARRRQDQVQDKIEGFAVPSWIDRVVPETCTGGAA